MATFMAPSRRPRASRVSGATARPAPARKPAPTENLSARFGTAESRQQLLDRVLGPSLAGVRVSRPSDPAERQADRIAADSARGSGAPAALQTLAEQAGGAAAPRGVASLSSGGVPLSDAARAHYEPRLGQSLAAVRVHTGPAAEQYTGAFRARAFSYGDHIFMGAGQGVQPSALLAHELAHVAQQRATGRLLVARLAAPEDDPDRKVSLGALDTGVIADIAPHVLGEGQFTLLRELLRGIVGGAQSAPPEQLAHIKAKFSSLGVRDTLHFAEGYAVGVGEGVWSSIKGLFEGLFHLIKLPYDIEQFLSVKVPELVVKYAPQLQELAREGEEIVAVGRQMLSDFLANPAAGAQQVAKLLEGLRDVALGKVRALGHDAVQQFLAFLDEPWQQFGEDIGKVAGMILFEVLLAVGTEAIGSLARGAGELAGRLAARVAGSAVELFAAARRLFGTALEAVERLVGRVAGKIAELLERLKGILRRLVEIIERMMGESAVTDTGLTVPARDVRAENIFESRALEKPPVRTAPAGVKDLKPDKIHPSKAEAPLPHERARPYDPSTTREELEQKHGAQNVASTTTPPSTAKNVGMAGQRHPAGIVFDVRGFPIFDDVAAADLRISAEQVASRDYTGQMRAATRQLRAQIRANPTMRSKFTSAQLRAIEGGRAQIPDYTWHHHQDVGRMQLVPTAIHSKVGHIGGFEMWYGR